MLGCWDITERRTCETDVWLDNLNDFGRSKIEEDYADRERFMPERTGGPGRIERHDFAGGWITLAVRHGLWSYFNAEGRARLGGPPEQPMRGRTAT
jgi:hypothetical protein